MHTYCLSESILGPSVTASKEPDLLVLQAVYSVVILVRVTDIYFRRPVGHLPCKRSVDDKGQSRRGGEGDRGWRTTTGERARVSVFNEELE